MNQSEKLRTAEAPSGSRGNSEGETGESAQISVRRRRKHIADVKNKLKNNKQLKNNNVIVSQSNVILSHCYVKLM